MKSVSVIIPCFNAGHWIRETLNSVLAQGIDGIEIIVVDDGSSDNSAYIIQREFPSVHLVTTKNQGPSKARNLGARLSKGEFIQYLDADDLLAPGKLKLQIELLEKSSEDIAYGDWQKISMDESGEYIKGEVVRRKIENPEIDLFTDFWCPLAVYLLRRSIVEKVGGWNENLPIIQDVRFMIDCALRGGSFVHCPEITAYYRVHYSNSISRRDPPALNRDCFRNAVEIERWWKTRGGINQERRKVLLKVYGRIARASFEKDRSTFEQAYQALGRLNPGYIPERPIHLRLMSKLVGYRKAESVAVWYRRIKSFI